MRWLVPFVLAAIAVSAPVAAQELKSDDDKALYAIGVALADRLAPFALSAAELELVKAGLADAVLGRERKADPREQTARIQQLRTARAVTVAAAEKKMGDAYLAKAAAAPGRRQRRQGQGVRVLVGALHRVGPGSGRQLDSHAVNVTTR